MSDNNFSDRLLASEQTNPAFRDKYEKEVKAMLEKRLTPAQRFGFGFSTILGVTFLVIFGYVAATAGGELPTAFRVLFGLGAVVGLVWAIIAGKITIKGTMNLKVHPNALTGLVWGFLVTFMVVMLMVVGENPDSVRSVYMVTYGLVFFIMGAVFMIVNRIEQSELKTREKLLEIELRLAELKESVEKQR